MKQLHPIWVALAGTLLGGLLVIGLLALTSADLQKYARTTVREPIQVSTIDRSQAVNSSTNTSPTSPEPLSATEAAAVIEATDTAYADPDVEALVEENERLLDLNQQLEGQLIDILNWILANFKGRYPLEETSLEKLNLSPVTDAFTLHPEVAEFLNISGEEEYLINDAFTYARDVISEIEQAELQYTENSAGKVVLHVPSYPQEGAILRDELYGALEVTLGDDRFDRFLTVSEEELESSFHYFGDATHTLIFQVTEPDEAGRPMVLVKDGWIMPGEDNQRIIQATETVLDTYPTEYAEYVPYLPDSMRLPLKPEYP